MKIESICAVYFSPTGTTKRVIESIAEKISESLERPLRRIDFTLPQDRVQPLIFQPADLVIFGVPVYAGRVPNILLKYLSSMNGCGALAVPVVVYGNRAYDDSLIELCNMMEEKSFSTIAAAAFIGEHSFSKTLAKGRPDEADMALIKNFAKKITDMLKNSTYTVPVAVSGETPIRPYYQPRDQNGRAIDIRKVKPKLRDSCLKCGLCVKVCPMGSIHPDHVEEYVNICIKCGACVKKCPVEARYYDDPDYIYHLKDVEDRHTRRAEPELFLK